MAARQPCMEMEPADEENMENTTEFYLDAFGLDIQQCLSAQDLHNLILEYKMFDPDEKERLLKYSDIKVPYEFFTEIIQSIRRMKGCPGKFTALRTALKNLGHEKAFLILSGEAFSDNQTHKKVLYNCSKEFRDMLTVEEILPNLIAEDLINDSDRQRIDRALEGKGHHSAAIELLKCLPNKKVEWYPSFMDILLRNNHENLAKIFEEELRRLSNDGEDTCISMKIIYNRQSVDEMGDTNPDILLEQFPTLAWMHELDEKSMRIYLNALEKGKENLKHIRLMVVGMIGVGKTCLVKRLQNEKIKDVSSTVGIEINVNVCEINEDDGCWTKSKGVPDSDIDGRVNDVLLNFKPDEQDPEPVKQTKSLEPVHKEKHQRLAENRHVRKQLPPKKEHNTGQFEENKEVKAISVLKKKDGTGEKINRPKASGRKPTVSLWDFSGRSTYYSTHHFFLSSRSIYVLVLDISKRLDEEVNGSYESFGNLQGPMKKYTCLDAFKFWVTSIYAYTQHQNMDEDIEGNQPTIILVGTFGDKLEVKDKGKDKEMQKDEYFEKALESFNEPIRKMFHKKAFLVSCTEDEDTVFDNIRAEISKIAKNQTYWSEKTPAKWLPLERFIEEKKKSKNKLMNFDDVKEADELKLEDKDEIKLFLKFQHFLGKVMYFDANGLDDTVILDPKWLIDMFKLFVKHRPFTDIPSELQDLWKEYKRNAKLAQPLLDYLIDHSAETKEGKKNLFKENKMHVVGYMEHLDVIVKPVYPKPQVNPEATNPKEIESNKDEEFYFVPCMLEQLKAAGKNDLDVVRQLLNLEHCVTGISTPVLCFVFDCKCLPPSIFHRLLASYIKKLQIKQQSTKYIIYNDFAAFKLDDIQTLCIWYTEFIIYARVKLHDPLHGVLYTDECIALRKELKDTLLSILLIDRQNHPQKRYVKGTFTEYIMCEHLFKNYPPNSPQPKKSHDAMDGFHEVRKIEQIGPKSKNCTCSIAAKTDHSISSDKALEYWYKEPKHLEHISAWFKRKEKDQGFLSEKPHSDDDFSELDKYLPAEGEEFYKLGYLLEVAPNTILELRNKGAVELIKKWTKQGKDENTWGLLKEKLYILKEEINRHY